MRCLPLIIFTIAFAFAITRLEAGKKQILAGFFEAMAEAMVTVISWVLGLAPIGVFRTGRGAGDDGRRSCFWRARALCAGRHRHRYIIMLSAYPVAMFGARFNLFDFAPRGDPGAVGGDFDPKLARFASRNGAGGKATWRRCAQHRHCPADGSRDFPRDQPGDEPGGCDLRRALDGHRTRPEQIVIGVAVASITTLGSVSLPGSISFIAAIAPICIAMGIPIEPLAVLVAIETFPDIMRTLGNVTMDIAVTGTIARAEGDLEKGEAA
jgi:proton glutamate symport protein